MYKFLFPILVFVKGTTLNSSCTCIEQKRQDNVKEIDNLEIGYKHEFMFTTKQHIQYDKFKTVVIDIV